MEPKVTPFEKTKGSEYGHRVEMPRKWTVFYLWHAKAMSNGATVSQRENQ